MAAKNSTDRIAAIAMTALQPHSHQNGVKARTSNVMLMTGYAHCTSAQQSTSAQA
jgi:hypothetical protein